MPKLYVFKTQKYKNYALKIMQTILNLEKRNKNLIFQQNNLSKTKKYTNTVPDYLIFLKKIR